MVGEDSDTITQMIERIVLYRKERSRATNVFFVTQYLKQIDTQDIAKKTAARAEKVFETANAKFKAGNWMGPAPTKQGALSWTQGEEAKELYSGFQGWHQNWSSSECSEMFKAEEEYRAKLEIEKKSKIEAARIEAGENPSDKPKNSYIFNRARKAYATQMRQFELDQRLTAPDFNACLEWSATIG